ncbi:MAG: CocE/NonD family hydrolase [Anaerolineales bacterium]|nr:CocE/NonD family hydrolase [Anaerolineales bacterium]
MNSRRTPFLLGLLAALTGVSLYQSRAQLIARWLHLSPPRHKITVTRNLDIPMRDGVILKADHYAPKSRGSFPTLLVRSIYGRGAELGLLGMTLSFPYARFAERGYHVIVQTTRGQFDSGGEFKPIFHETEDGLDTIAWIEDQPWFNGNLGMWGQSYLTHTQWAVAAKAPPSLKALVPAVMTTEVHELSFMDGVPNIELSLRWIMILAGIRALVAKGPHKMRDLANPAKQTPLLTKALQRPLLDADTFLTGLVLPHYRDGLMHPDPTSSYWDPLHFRATLPNVRASALFVSGWYDMSLGGLLTDFATLRATGQTPFLTIGPWHHLDPSYTNDCLREGLDWFESRLKGNHHPLRKEPVKIFVMGADEWREMETWPPAATLTSYYLRPHAELGRTPAGGAFPPTGYHFDPANPTPAVGGARFSPDGGRKDQRRVESRADVLSFTTSPLEHDLEVIGPVHAVLYVKSSLPHTDFIARLCDVSEKGLSENLCDGLFHLTPDKGDPQPDGTRKIEIDLWATANHFKKGHCIRLQIASAGVPRWALTPGDGTSPASATHFLPADQEIFHDEAHPSRVILPVIK